MDPLFFLHKKEVKTLKKIILFILLFTLVLTNTVFASWNQNFEAEKSNSNTNPGSGSGSSGSGNDNRSPSSSNSVSSRTPRPTTNIGSVRIGYLKQFSKTNYYTNPGPNARNTISREINNFWSTVNNDISQGHDRTRILSKVIPGYDFIIGNLNDTSDYSRWSRITGSYRLVATYNQGNIRRTNGATRTKEFRWQVIGGNTQYPKVTRGRNNTVTFLEPGTYNIKAIEIREHDTYEERIANITVKATHNGVIIQNYTSTSNRVKTGTKTLTGKVSNWELVIGPNDVGKPIGVGNNIKQTNKDDKIEIDIELVE